MLSYCGAEICQALPPVSLPGGGTIVAAPILDLRKIGGSNDSTTELSLECGEAFLNTLYLCVV